MDRADGLIGTLRNAVKGEASFVSRAAVNPLRCAVLLRAGPGQPSVAARSTHTSHPWTLRQNFLRFCNPATLRKPVICLSWQIPLDVYVSPVFFTPRTTSKRSIWVRE
jgi:hypothetical protein